MSKIFTQRFVNKKHIAFISTIKEVCPRFIQTKELNKFIERIIGQASINNNPYFCKKQHTMGIVTKFEDLDLTKEYTYSDYLLFRFQERVELIKGRILKMSPAPSRNHQTISQNINYIVYGYFKEHKCNVYVAPFDVRLPVKKAKKNSTVVQPDLCIICDESKLDDQGCNGAPDLIIEILSPNNSKHDIDTKFNLYQESGVLEYWIVEPFEKMVLVYTLQNEIYIGSKPFSEGTSIESKLFPELKIGVNQVFENVK